jgi:hypothetical protein
VVVDGRHEIDIVAQRPDRLPAISLHRQVRKRHNSSQILVGAFEVGARDARGVFGGLMSAINAAVAALRNGLK